MPPKQREMYDRIIYGHAKYCLKTLLKYQLDMLALEEGDEDSVFDISNKDEEVEKNNGNQDIIFKNMKERLMELKHNSKCFDIFRNVRVYDYRMYQDMPTKHFVAYKN